MLNLGDQPSSDFFPPVDESRPDPTWPLIVDICTTCLLVQLRPVVDYTPAEPLAVESLTMQRHARTAARRLLNQMEGDRSASVIEASSHHGGSWLAELTAGGLQGRGLGECADIVLDVHALAHEPDIDSAIEAHSRRLAPGGRLILEFHHLLPLVEQGQFDTIRLGHWSYISLLALEFALNRHELTATDVEQVPVYGGSLVVTARRQCDDPVSHPAVESLRTAEQAAGLDDPVRLQYLQERAEASCRALRSFLEQAKQAGRQVAGYGAPSKASVLLCTAAIGPALLPYTVDLSRDKHGRRIPGCAIPIEPLEKLVNSQPDDVLILTWDIAAEVVDQLQHAGLRSRYLVPLPTPHLFS